MTEDPEIKISTLCRPVTRNGKTVQVEIFSDGANGWILEVVDEYNNSTVWDESFKTEQEALDEAMRTIENEGIESVIGLGKTVIH